MLIFLYCAEFKVINLFHLPISVFLSAFLAALNSKENNAIHCKWYMCLCDIALTFIRESDCSPEKNNVSLLTQIPQLCGIPALGKLRKRMRLTFILPAAFVLFRGFRMQTRSAAFLWNSCTPHFRDVTCPHTHTRSPGHSTKPNFLF